MEGPRSISSMPNEWTQANYVVISAFAILWVNIKFTICLLGVASPPSRVSSELLVSLDYII